MTRIERGFTLLEVMAAVAIVAIVFTTLARVASQGLHSEGSSKRRLEASLLADSALADLEAQFEAGLGPELGSEETEEGLFTVIVEVTAFDLAAAFPRAEVNGESGTSLASSFETGGSNVSPLRQIEIRVVWDEGVDEYQVMRTTFGIDPVAIESLLGSALAVDGAAP